MIVAAVVAPNPPLLLRELSGAQDAVPELRAACRDALAAALATQPDGVVVVGAAEVAQEWDPSLPVEVHRFGTTTASRVTGLPLSLGVAKRLLEDAGWFGPSTFLSLPSDAGPETVAEVARAVRKVGGRQVLLVLGDGSTRRGDKAPGYLDERAFPYDDEIVRAVGEGDAAALTRLDRDLARELMVLGRSAFGVLGEAVTAQGGRPTARLLYRDDPYGVQYTVAFWDLS